MQLVYHLVNVFTCAGAALSGNPLCVFEDGSGLTTDQMQALARQFNLSETTFILPSDAATAGVRIFTPDFEMPFAGHPTLGTAHIVRMRAAARGSHLQALTLSMPAGVIAVQADANRWTLQANKPESREIEYTRAQLAAALGLAPDDIVWETGGPRPLWVNTGSEQLIVPLRSVDAVCRTSIQADHIANLRSVQGRRMAQVFAVTGPEQLLVRFFFEGSGAYLEDPATGSACANLGGWLLATGQAGPLQRVLSQGEQVLRPSTLRLGIDAASRIHVGGDVIYLGKGELQI
jgi:PhzF family phenazine biosynthesis protein